MQSLLLKLLSSVVFVYPTSMHTHCCGFAPVLHNQQCGDDLSSSPVGNGGLQVALW